MMGEGTLPEKEIQERQDEIGEMSAALNNLVTSVKLTSNFAKEIGQGNFDSEYSALSSDDTLGNSLIIMRDNLKVVADEDSKRNWSTGGMAKFGEILRRNSDNLSSLSTALISDLIKYLQANQGGVFVLNDEDEDDQYLELTGCYAWDRVKYLDQKIGIGDGLVGQAWQEKSTLYITDVPDNYVNIKCMLTRPLRIFGKMTLNPGNIPHTYNEIYLNKFGLGNREIPIIVEEVKDGTMTYNSKKTRLNKNSSRNYYVSPYLREQKKDEPFYTRKAIFFSYFCFWIKNVTNRCRY